MNSDGNPVLITGLRALGLGNGTFGSANTLQRSSAQGASCAQHRASAGWLARRRPRWQYLEWSPVDPLAAYDRVVGRRRAVALTLETLERRGRLLPPGSFVRWIRVSRVSASVESSSRFAISLTADRVLATDSSSFEPSRALGRESRPHPP